MEKLKEIFERLKDKAEQLDITLNPSAKPKQIRALESFFGQRLPQDLIDFYSFCNGFETLDALFRIVPIEEIIGWKSGLTSFDFAEYMIYSDTWQIHLKNEEQYYITNEDQKSGCTVILTTSITEFIERYIDGGGVFGENGLYSWFDQIKLTT